MLSKGEKCSLCDKKFTRKNDATRHELSIHLGLKPYTCSLCDKSFFKKNHLMGHENTHTREKPYNHTGEKLYTCSLCDKKFKQKYDATRHELSIHTGEKPYNCAYCDAKFTRKNDAKRHNQRFHAGEKRLCDKKFTRKNDAKRHERSIHTKEKPKNIKEDLVNKKIDNEDSTDVFETNTTNEAKKEMIEDDDIKEYENTDEITSLTDPSVTEEEISLNEQNTLVIHLTENNLVKADEMIHTGESISDEKNCLYCLEMVNKNYWNKHNELCIEASTYLNEEMCLICDMQFHTSVEALNHIKKDHIDIIEPKKEMIEDTDEITSPLVEEIDKKMENPFSCAVCKKAFSQPNDLQNHVESNHLNTSLEDTPMSKHIQSQHPTDVDENVIQTVKSKINKKNTLFTKENTLMTKQKISFTEDNPSDLVDKKIDNEDSTDVFETNTTNEAKYQVDLTDDNPVTEEDTSMSNAEIGLYQCKICKDVTDSFKDFFQHIQNGCSLWKFLSPINKQNTSMNEGNIPKTKEGKSSRNKAKKRTLIKDRNENGKVKISKMSKEVDDTFLPEENSSMIDDKSSEEKNLFINEKIPFGCRKCNSKFSSFYGLEKHMKSFHAWKPKCTNKIKSVGAI